MKEGGPKEFVKKVASCRSESKKIEYLQESLRYCGNKGAGDTIIDLGMAENCMALGARIYGLLKKVGVEIAPDDVYKQME